MRSIGRFYTLGETSGTTRVVPIRKKDLLYFLTNIYPGEIMLKRHIWGGRAMCLTSCHRRPCNPPILGSTNSTRLQGPRDQHNGKKTDLA
jgi:hypothetical protein